MDNNNQPNPNGTNPTQPTVPPTNPTPDNTSTSTSTTPTDPTPNATSTSSPETPTNSTPKNKGLIIGVITIVIVAIIAIVATVLIINSNKDNNSTNQDQTSQGSNDKTDDKQSEQKTLSIADLSVKYPAGSWKEEDAEDDNVSISKGDEYYLMLAHTTGQEQGATEGQTFTTEEFADVITATYDEMGFEQSGSITDQTINGKTWKRAQVSSDGVWLTMLFCADGDDYYVVTFGSESRSVPTEAEDILKTLTIK